MLLIHGDADDVVPLAQATALSASLDEHGVDVTTTVLPGGGHDTVIDEAVVGPLIETWLAGGA